VHTIKLRVEDKIYEHILFLLNSLKSKGVIIEHENTKEDNSIDFSQYKIDSFAQINNPVKWQNDIRNEWDNE